MPFSDAPQDFVEGPVRDLLALEIRVPHEQRPPLTTPQHRLAGPGIEPIVVVHRKREQEDRHSVSAERHFLPRLIRQFRCGWLIERRRGTEDDDSERGNVAFLQTIFGAPNPAEAGSPSTRNVGRVREPFGILPKGGCYARRAHWCVRSFATGPFRSLSWGALRSLH